MKIYANLQDLITKKEWHAIATTYAPEDLATAFSFKEGFRLATKIWCNDDFDMDLHAYATRILEAIRQRYPEQWLSSYKYELYLAYFYDLIDCREKSYEIYRNFIRKAAAATPAAILINFASHAINLNDSSVSNAEAYLEKGIEDHLYLDGVGELRSPAHQQKNYEVEAFWWMLYLCLLPIGLFAPLPIPELVEDICPPTVPLPLSRNASLHEIMITAPAHELVQKLPFNEVIELARKCLYNDTWMRSLHRYSIELLEAARAHYPNEWREAWHHDGLLGSAYYLTFNIEKQYETYLRALQSTSQPSAELLVAFANCSLSKKGNGPVKRQEAIGYLELAMSKELLPAGMWLLTSLYKLNEDSEKENYWKQRFHTIVKGFPLVHDFHRGLLVLFQNEKR